LPEFSQKALFYKGFRDYLKTEWSRKLFNGSLEMHRKMCTMHRFLGSFSKEKTVGAPLFVNNTERQN